ncbi:MAG: T9SS type A sorting domain-containing protein [Bacteroidales bacterium]|nr:T9SS type A sorting domain-containing protein [Bacteroidales bacterium]
MKIFVFSNLFFLVFSFQSFSQPFVLVNSGLENIERGIVRWGDYDNDNDLDLLICGNSGEPGYENLITKVYNNSEGYFTEINANLIGLKNCSGLWADFDNDGDLDIILSGMGDSVQTLVYQNNYGEFEEISTEIIGLGYSGMAVGDYDNDGDIDLAIAGDAGYYTMTTKVYRNEGNFVFTDIDADLIQVSSASVSWVDYDLDGGLDLIVSGDIGAGPATQLYKNVNDLFMLVETDLPDLFASSVVWGDFDSDGDPDLLITGMNEYLEPVSRVMSNAGDDLFFDTFSGLTGVALGTGRWGDYDNDGDLDILLTGNGAGCGVTVSQVYYNNNGYFNLLGLSLPGLTNSAGTWGDYDNDGDLDILLAGTNLDGLASTLLYRNDVDIANTIPDTPANQQVIQNGNMVTLCWSKSLDLETPASALTYNIRVGTEPGLGDIVSPMSDESSGYRKRVTIGNTGQDSCKTLHNLEQGTYYWGVQAVDNVFAGSWFSEEMSFEVLASGINHHSSGLFSVYPNPTTEKLFISSSAGFSYPVNIQVLDLKGLVISEQRLFSLQHEVIIDKIPKGIYVIRIINDNMVLYSQKVVIN